MTMTTYDWAIDHRSLDATDEVFAAMTALREFALQHELPVGHADFTPAQPGASRFDGEAGDWVPVQPEISMPVLQPGVLLLWAEALDASGLAVKRRERDFIVSARVSRGGFCWYVGASVPQFDSRMAGTDVQWDREHGRLSQHGRITVASFRNYLAGHGYRFVDGTPVEAVAK